MMHLAAAAGGGEPTAQMGDDDAAAAAAAAAGDAPPPSRDARNEDSSRSAAAAGDASSCNGDSSCALLELPAALLAALLHDYLLRHDVRALPVLRATSKALAAAAGAAAAQLRSLSTSDNGRCFLNRKLPPTQPLASVLPALHGLRALSLDHAHHAVTADALRELAASPCAAQLTLLSLCHCQRFGDRGLRALFAPAPGRRRFERLRVLRLDHAGDVGRGSGGGGGSGSGGGAASGGAAGAGAGGGSDCASSSSTTTTAPSNSGGSSCSSSLGSSWGSGSGGAHHRLWLDAATTTDWLTPEALPALVELSANYLWALPLPALERVAPQLTALSLKSCTAGDGLCARLPRIVDLDISRTGVGDAGLLALAAGSPRLARLRLAPKSSNLWNDGAHSEAGLRAFAAARPGVVVEEGWGL